MKNETGIGDRIAEKDTVDNNAIEDKWIVLPNSVDGFQWIHCYVPDWVAVRLQKRYEKIGNDSLHMHVTKTLVRMVERWIKEDAVK
jgi:hypothetical protein